MLKQINIREGGVNIRCKISEEWDNNKVKNTIHYSFLTS